MDKRKIKAFVIYAKKDLLNRVSDRLKAFNEEQNISLKHVEEASYDLFIRFICIKYMEVNGFIEEEEKLFSKYDLMYKDELGLEYDKGLSCEFNYDFKSLCHKLGKVIPEVFPITCDYAESLLPNNLLYKDSFIRKLSFYNEFFGDNVEVIGWIHQYYISDKKDEVFKKLKKNIKICKDNIPNATQFFTPKWIVEYMVKNTLNKFNTPHIKILDPCMGTAHILVYVFDELYKIYSYKGYNKKDIPRYILENNIYGLDLDKKVTNIACFSLKMKGRHYNEDFLSELKSDPLILNLCYINESNDIGDKAFQYFCNVKGTEVREKLQCEFKILMRNFKNAKEYGSLIKIENLNYEILEQRLEEIKIDNSFFYKLEREIILENIPILIKQGKILSYKYDVCITNPPYMGIRGMNKTLAKYVTDIYPLSKHDLFSVYMEVCYNFLLPKGLCAMINPHSWMFLNSFSKMRMELLKKVIFLEIIHLGSGVFEEDVGTIIKNVVFIFKKDTKSNYITTCIDLTKESDNYHKKKVLLDFTHNHKSIKCFYRDLNYINVIPGLPFAYWVSSNILKIFKEEKKLEVLAKPRQGMATSNNKKFLRKWFEVDYDKICFNALSSKEAVLSNKKWFPYNKGGESRKWYGNNEYIINWEDDGHEVKEYAKNLYKSYSRTIKNEKYYFKKGITYTFISQNMCARYTGSGFIFDVAGSSIFLDNEEDLFVVLGLLCSKVANLFIDIMNPTFNIQVGDIKNIPLVKDIFKSENKHRIISLVKENIEISKENWDFFEISWDFKAHPFILFKEGKLNETYNKYEEVILKQFNKLKENEEKLNEIFINVYNLNNELTPEVSKDYITLKEYNLKDNVKSFISYAVGCILGRYKIENYKPVDILPLNHEELFKDNIMTKFIELLKIFFGEENLEYNLNFIAYGLGNKKKEKSEDIIRKYFIKNFYLDHVKTYGKTPIYWMFNSHNEDSFKVLVYMKKLDVYLLKKLLYEYFSYLKRSSNYIRAVLCLIKKNVVINLDEGVKANYRKFQNVIYIDDEGKEIKCSLLEDI